MIIFFHFEEKTKFWFTPTHGRCVFHEEYHFFGDFGEGEIPFHFYREDFEFMEGFYFRGGGRLI